MHCRGCIESNAGSISRRGPLINMALSSAGGTLKAMPHTPVRSALRALPQVWTRGTQTANWILIITLTGGPYQSNAISISKGFTQSSAKHTSGRVLKALMGTHRHSSVNCISGWGTLREMPTVSVGCALRAMPTPLPGRGVLNATYRGCTESNASSISR